MPYTCHTKQVTLNRMKSMLPPRNPPSSQGDLSLETVLSLLWMLAPTNNTLEKLRLLGMGMESTRQVPPTSLVRPGGILRITGGFKDLCKPCTFYKEFLLSILNMVKHYLYKT